MKKTDVKRILLLAFAAVAVYVCFLPNSVVVYSLAQNVVPAYCSYFTLVEDVAGSICLPAAALCACIVLTLSGIYAVSKKQSLMSAVKIISMAGSILAVVPILLKDGTVQMVPNVLVPIALLAEYVVAYYLGKKTEPEPSLSGKRLK